MKNLINILASDNVVAPWVASSFPIIKLVVMCLILLCSIFMIVAVLMQKGTSNGVTGVTGDKSDTFYNRNRKRSTDNLVKKLTVIDAVVILVLCLGYLILNAIYAGGLV